MRSLTIPAAGDELPAVVADLHEPDSSPLAAVVLAHGAGGDRNAAILRAYADEFCARGLLVARIDLPYRQQRPKGPPSPSRAAVDRAGIRRAMAQVRDLAGGIPLIVGGHSYGGRQASMVVAEDGGRLTDGLFLSSYPLHPPGKPERLRTEHLPQITVPTVVVHGRTDPFASADELAAAVALIDAPTRIVTVAAPHALNPAKTDVARLAADAVMDVIVDPA
ncbi:MAG: alpha/beta hydrolase [Gordonia sp. (in: high G+C Gram-positive bacteria)]|uniref:alpha/beta hydrolase family protein n=1 Tax=Gordonia sp. (in: high G+C Gram-positive bacteria) TaxID=84139 RepID=UPI0039E627A7